MEKQTEEKTEKDVTVVKREVREEESTLSHLMKKLEAIEKKVDSLSQK